MASVRCNSLGLALCGLGLAWLASAPAEAAVAKTHSVTLGAARKVPWLPPTAAPAAAGSDMAAPSGAAAGSAADRAAGVAAGPVAGQHGPAATMRVRPLFVDGRQKEWTTGDAHDVTDRSYVIRRALRLNDSLPGDPAEHWSWQPGPWLLVDRSTGHIAALHLPDFDNVVSDAAWYRDYAAYCGVAQTAKGGLYAIVAQIGVRRAVVQKQIGRWPQAQPPEPVCQPARWQRDPMRVTLEPTGTQPMTFAVVGAAALIEDSEADTDESKQ